MGEDNPRRDSPVTRVKAVALKALLTPTFGLAVMSSWGTETYLNLCLSSVKPSKLKPKRTGACDLQVRVIISLTERRQFDFQMCLWRPCSFFCCATEEQPGSHKHNWKSDRHGAGGAMMTRTWRSHAPRQPKVSVCSAPPSSVFKASKKKGWPELPP